MREVNSETHHLAPLDPERLCQLVKEEYTREILPIEKAKHRELLTESDVSALYNIPKPTLKTWRSRGKGPNHVKIGSKVLYRHEDVKAWINSRVVRVQDV